MKPDKLAKLDMVIRICLSTITNTNIDRRSVTTSDSSRQQRKFGHSQIFPGVDLDDATAKPARRWEAVTGIPIPVESKTQKWWDTSLSTQCR
ncbi:hypothetical protein BV898_14892 [Hypsibius exemplaris]|uniref:Uncharacterized protein n=1 Tax=Hypsibius exemplaris TaxID=2072580 RepID=A0A9X6RJQ3_HYPEX|nr:hypothetical protein BV898_14892 [Hypsibius exemplaris]